ncbi:MAG TPA: Na+/H+ antiporter NhaC family protein [Pseudomonadales bacterium]|nr:Na+/H+ antiporter NhaC family protein [Pseudomonadales bacterium]
MTTSNSGQSHPSFLALTPLFLFLLLFLGSGLFFSLSGDAMGFYRLHAPVAIIPAIVLAVFLGRKFEKKPMDTLLEGMGDSGIMQMTLIFLLAGAFANVTKQIGGVDAVVYLGISTLPAEFLLPGLFLISGLIALSMGTSMGTIAAVVPIAVGLAETAGLNLALTVGSVVGGAMFGDNLSVISDTTIAATRTQGANMRDKFKENLWLAMPAAIIMLVVLFFMSAGTAAAEVTTANYLLAIPYLVVLILAVSGVNVLSVLVLGIVLAGGLGIVVNADYTGVIFVEDIWQGFQNLFEITLLSILIGGLAALMRAQGGLAWIVQSIIKLSGKSKSRRSGEASIASLAALMDVFTANNTVAILISGSVAKELAERNNISPSRSASLLDVFSCVMQGVLPYGAQILLAASIAQLSPLVIAGHVYYCWILAVVAILALLVGWPHSIKNKSSYA